MNYWTCPACKVEVPEGKPCKCGMLPPVARPMPTFEYPPVTVVRLQIPFGDIFATVFKIGLAMVPVGILLALIWSAVRVLFGVALFSH